MHDQLNLRVTRNGVAHLFELDREAISDLERRGVLEFGDDGQITVPDVARSLFDEACLRARQAEEKAVATQTMMITIGQVTEEFLKEVAPHAVSPVSDQILKFVETMTAVLVKAAPVIFSPLGAQPSKEH